VEVGVQIVDRWILFRLRNHRFYSLAELNTEIRRLLALLNAKPFKKMPGSRQSWFEEIERPALRPLPLARYEFATFSKAKVHIDYHIQVDYHYYSVPYQLVGETVEVLVEGTSKKSHASEGETGPVQLTGRTMTDHIAVFDGNERLIGQTVKVVVEEATSFTLFGTVVTGEQVGVIESVCEQPPMCTTEGEAAPQRIGLPLI